MKNFELKHLIVNLLPTFLRKKRLFSLIYSLLIPIESLKSDFFTNRRKNIAEANQTGQVCVLENLLNNLFDDSLYDGDGNIITENRRIKIIDGNTSDWTILWRKYIIENDLTPSVCKYENGQILIMLSKADTIETSSGHVLYKYNTTHLVSKQGSVGSIGYDFTIRIPNAIKPMTETGKKSFESQIVSIVNKYKLVSKRYNWEYYE